MKHIALYGNISMSRGVCSQCNSNALIIDDRYQCCGSRAYQTVVTKIKRVTQPEQRRRRPSKVQMEVIMTRQNRQCFYCDNFFNSRTTRNGRVVNVNIAWDHQVPYAFSQNNDVDNFVAACTACNSIKGSKLFVSVEEARTYINQRRDKKGYGQ